MEARDGVEGFTTGSIAEAGGGTCRGSNWGSTRGDIGGFPQYVRVQTSVVEKLALSVVNNVTILLCLP